MQQAVVTILAVMTSFASAQTVASWPIAGVVDSGSPLVGMEISSFAVTHGAGLSNHLAPRMASGAYMADGWPAGAAEACRYVQFSIRATPGRAIDYTTFAFKVVADDPGVCDWELRASHDDFATVLDSGTVVDLTAGGAPTTAAIDGIGTLRELVRLRLYLFNNAGGANPGRRGLLGTSAGGLDPTLTGATPTSGATLLAEWSVTGSTNSNNALPPVFVGGGVDVEPFRKSPAVGGVSGFDAYVASGFPAGVRDPAKYFEFAVTPEYGRGIAYSNIVFSVEASTVLFNFASSWQIRTSADNFGSILASGTYSTSQSSSDTVANIQSLGLRTEPVVFRFYYHGNFGASPDRRGFQRWFGPGPHNGDGPKVNGVISVMDTTYPGTHDDLRSHVATGSGPYTPVNIPLAASPGTAIAVKHDSPGGSLALTGDVVVLCSTAPTGAGFPSPFPGLWIEFPTAVVILDAVVLGFPVIIPPLGLTWSFTYPGGLAGTSALIQCHVISTNTCNGLLASTDGLEVQFL